ncbi:MAG: DUF748 domain-containing protein [Colwellia sp.]
MASLITFFTHKFFKVLFAVYLILFLLIWLISSPVTKHFIRPILAEYQLQLSDDASIRFNPFLMHITLSDIDLSSTKEHQQGTVFSLQELQIQVALWQLAFDKIVLSKFSLTEGMLKITQHDGHLVIAGVEIPSSDKALEETNQETSVEGTVENTAAKADEGTDEPASEFPYQFLLPNLLLSQFHIEIERDSQQQINKTHHIIIEQLALNQLKATQSNQQAILSLTALIDKVPLAFTANMDLTLGEGDINSNIRLTNYPLEKLARYVEQLTELKGELSFNSQQTITLTKDGIKLRVQEANLDLQSLLLGLAQQHITLDELQYKFANLEVDLQGGAITHLAGESSMKLTDAAFNDNESKGKIAAFSTLNLAEIKFVLDDEPSIDITDIVLDEFLFSKKATLADDVIQKALDKINKLSEESGIDIAAEALVKLPPVMHLKQLTLTKLHIHEKSIAINSILFDSLTGDIIIKENKEIANLVALGDKEATEQTVSAEQATSTEQPDQEADTAEKNEAFIFSFNEIRFINENVFAFSDFSVDPFYQRTLFIDTLEVGALGNSEAKQQEKTPFTLIGRSNKYANFNLAGYLQPFATLPSYHIKGDFKEISLPAISTYLKASTGLEVKTGQLNLDLDVSLEGDELDGNVVVLLQALETGLVDNEEAGNLIKQGALPLNMAMGMLKDSAGNVELSVPLSGSTSDPSFGLSSIVTLITQKAIISATQEYLMTTFVPYANIVSIAITAGEYALKLRFDDLEYQIKQIEPNDSQSAYLNEFIALMQNKEDTRVTICAISVPEDIDLKAGKKVTDKAAIKRLIELGEKREHAFKDYLIDKGEIKSSRILFCTPQIDSGENAIPHIAISV